MNEKVIWDFLIQRTGNAYGTAAIMGNLMAESSLNPLCATGTKNPDYALDADSGKVDFVHDGVAFGLVQWCYYSRKESLINFACSEGTSVGNLQTQLKFMWKELLSYKTVLNAVINAVDIRDASDIVMLRYEKPATTTEEAKKKRANYGQLFFNQFSKQEVKQEPKKSTYYVVATDNVRIRAGDSKSYGQIGMLKKGQFMEYVVTSNGFHAVRMKDRIGWVSSEFSEVRK